MEVTAKKFGMLNCESCGGALKYSADGLSARCPYCGNEYRFSGGKSQALALALNRASAMRINCDFDGAIREYRLITESNPQDAEARWGLAISKYGIEYVDDARTGRKIPTCRRTVRGSILQDEDFLAAVRYAAPAQAEVYRSRAAVIDRLQRDIKRKMEEEEDFDVFLCFRSADDNGAPTRERTVARRIYDELSRRGIKTFFSEVTLKDRLGEDFEPIIFKALYSCRFFVLIACSEENINSPWVKNEWSRFRDREEEEHLSGACCAVYDMPVSSLPPFIRSRQGINLAKYPAGGYEIELADSLAARFSKNTARAAEPGGDITLLLARAGQDLSAELYESARTKYLQALDADPYCGEAWWGCFLAGRGAYSGGIAAQNMTYEGALSIKDDRNLKNAELYGNAEIKEKVSVFRKMCAFRCKELADECGDTIRRKQKRLAEINAARNKASDEKLRAQKKLEKCRKTLKSNPKIIIFPMVFAAVFMFAIFLIIGLTADADELIYVGIGMAAMCLFAGLMAYFGSKRNISTAKSEEERLVSVAEIADGEIERLGGEAAECEKSIAENRRRQEAFLKVFYA